MALEGFSYMKELDRPNLQITEPSRNEGVIGCVGPKAKIWTQTKYNGLEAELWAQIKYKQSIVTHHLNGTNTHISLHQIW